MVGCNCYFRCLSMHRGGNLKQDMARVRAQSAQQNTRDGVHCRVYSHNLERVQTVREENGDTAGGT